MRRVPAVSSRNISLSRPMFHPPLNQQPTLIIPKWLSCLWRPLFRITLTPFDLALSKLYLQPASQTILSRTFENARFPADPLLSNEHTKSTYPSHSHPVPIIRLLLDQLTLPRTLRGHLRANWSHLASLMARSHMLV